LGWKRKVLIVGIIGGSVFAWGSYEAWKQQNLDTSAKQRGFENHADYQRALSSQVFDPDVWKKRLVDERAVAEVQRQATASAKAKADKEAVARKAEEDAAKAVEEIEFQIAVRAARALKQSMKNPDSFKLEETIKTDAGALCFTYRAANSFNALVPGRAVIAAKKAYTSDNEGFSSYWNKHCGGKPGRSMSHVAYALKYY
jgi:hypothetical protein